MNGKMCLLSVCGVGMVVDVVCESRSAAIAADGVRVVVEFWLVMVCAIFAALCVGRQLKQRTEEFGSYVRESIRLRAGEVVVPRLKNLEARTGARAKQTTLACETCRSGACNPMQWMFEKDGD